MSDETNSPNNSEQSQESSGNPAWNDLLSVVPEDYHQALTPVLQNWDKGVNERFQNIHNDYADFKPFKEQGFTGEDIDFAISLASRIENDPLDIYRALESHLRETGLLDGLSGQEDDEDDALENDSNLPPEYAQLQEGYNVLAEYLLQQEAAKEEAEADAILDQELGELRSKYGDFDEQFVLSKAVYGGMQLEDAVKAYQEFENSLIAKANRPAPLIVGSGGLVANNQTIDPKTLDEKGRLNLIAQYLDSQKDS